MYTYPCNIQTYSGISRHNQVYSGIIQAYCKPYVILRKFKTSLVILTNSELWYIHNPDIFKTRSIFRTLVYPKVWHIQNKRHIQKPELFRTESILGTLLNIYDGALWEIVNGYHYFCKLDFFFDNKKNYQKLIRDIGNKTK